MRKKWLRYRQKTRPPGSGKLGKFVKSSAEVCAPSQQAAGVRVLALNPLARAQDALLAVPVAGPVKVPTPKFNASPAISNSFLPIRRRHLTAFGAG